MVCVVIVRWCCRNFLIVCMCLLCVVIVLFCWLIVIVEWIVVNVRVSLFISSVVVSSILIRVNFVWV